MAGKQKKYDREYKIQAVKLSKEIGGAKAAAELGIPVDTEPFPKKRTRNTEKKWKDPA